MSRRAATLVLGLAALLLLGGLVWWALSEQGGGLGARLRGEPADANTEPVSLPLYYPGDGGVLRAETRELQVTEAPRDRVRKIVQALLAGPKQRGLYRPFPEGVVLGAVALQDGTAYIDLRWDGHDEPPQSGSTEEIQRVYSIVNSVTLNVPEAQRVVLLWNSLQRPTFAGHLDLSVPVTPYRALIAR